MKPRTAIVLLVIALAGWAAVLLWEKDLPGTEERLEKAGLLLPQVDRDAVRRVEIRRPDQAILLEREDTGKDTRPRWRLREPIEDRADGSAVDSLLSDLLETKERSSVAPGELAASEEEAGLGKEAIHVILAGEGFRHELVVSGKPLPGGLRYVRVDGTGPLHLVGGGLADAVTRPVDELRDRQLLGDVSTVDVASLDVLEDGKRTLSFVRREGDDWWIVAPIEDDADNTLVGDLVSRVTGARAERFVDDPPGPDGEIGLDPPAYAFRAALRSPREGTVELQLGDETPSGAGRRWAAVPGRPGRFEVYAATILGLLDRDPDDWRSRLALDYSAWDVLEFDLERDGTKLTVSRVEDGSAPEKWVPLEPADFPLDPDAADRLVQDLARTEVVRLAPGTDPVRVGLDHPVARLVIRRREPERFPDLVLEIGDPAGEGGCWARRVGRSVPFVIRAETAARIDPRRLRRAPEEDGDASPGEAGGKEGGTDSATRPAKEPGNPGSPSPRPAETPPPSAEDR